MRDFVILTDSCCDLTPELAQELGLTVIPLSLEMSGATYHNYLDGREIGFHDFYERIRSGETATTSAVSGLLQTVRDDAEEMDGYVALISHKHKTAFLEAANGTYHDISFGNAVSINGITYENVMMLDDLPCIFVPQSRMKTAITVQSGDSNSGGIVAGEGAKDISCLITHCETPLAVSKLDAIKQFGPQENQLFDGTSIQARYLYDLFVPGKRLASIGAVVAP